MRILRLLPFSLVLLLPGALSAASATSLRCPTSDQLLRASIECAASGRKPSLVRDNACRKLLCEDVPLCQAPAPQTPVQSRVQQLQAKAFGGNAEAMYLLGTMYHTGQGAGRSEVRAFAWLALADAYGYDIPNDEELQAYFASTLDERDSERAYALVKSLGSRIRAKDSPTAAFGSRDAQRKTDAQAILDAVHKYVGDAGGVFPAQLTSIPKEVCRADQSDCLGMIDLTVLVGKYLSDIPRDPLAGEGRGTWYFISIDASQRVTVTAPRAEGGSAISVTK